ncbi:DUF5677 domain-containing protein [Microbacterium esteraromaticum]|uniref:DUF5677 domain-containing protein n=1 Tax=Microbacterium esteraromaticum TaxID=57043 RepID=UPI0023684587|nr:DUF5677 domain-containing protein [Microbacterium esteraromaticum]WDH78813.1 DUF5677 domain-containing protein [Microbacterium esteraromaticum]
MNDARTAEDEPEEFRRQRAFLIETAPLLAEDFLRVARESRQARAEKDTAFAEDISHIWARGWTVVDAVINSMEQSAALMFPRAEIKDAHSDTREALLLLQCSSTLTLREIRELLRAGYLAGAAARWRALHETAVTAVVVAEGGAQIARRYLDHGIVTQFTRLEEFYRQPHPDAPSDEERAERMALVADLIRAHTLVDESLGFAKPYGWATPLMKRRRDGKYLEPTFTRLEELARQSNMRLLVQHGAHGHVHGDAGAVRTSVLRDGVELLAGPRTDEIPAVAVPTLRSIAVIAGATHMGFEPELNEFGRLICLTGAALTDLAMRGVDEFKSVHRTARLLF